MADDTADATTAQSFADKWLARWPEWRIGNAFVPTAQRPATTAWFALLQEFTLAAWTGEDATPGLAKLAWWNEELIGWSKGARRHPLGVALLRSPADWGALAATLRALQATRDRAPTADAGASGLDVFSARVAEIEARLFPDDRARQDDDAPRLPPATADCVLADLLTERALLHADAAVARLLLEKGAKFPAFDRGTVSRPRRLQSAFLRARLQRLAAGAPVQPSSPPRSLLLAWRAARG